jgi:alanine racemase
MNNIITNLQTFRIALSQPINPEFLQNWIELSASAVEHNAAQFAQWLGPDTKIAAVIKSNAYGHGLIEMASLYDQCSNIAALCTINLTEAISVRQAGVVKPIFVIGYLDAQYDLIVQYDIQVVVYDLDIAHKLNAIGQKYQQKIQVHIKFDTGMSRLGIVAQDLDAFIDQIKTLPWLSIAGIFSHLAQSYDQSRTDEQQAVFAAAFDKNVTTHLSNSHGSLTTQQKKYHFARIGIGLYGYLQKHAPEEQSKLRPVLSLKSRILQIKSVSAGTKIGYDGMFQATKPMTIATIALGYHEGLDARLSNCGAVIINDQFAPIIGRVCMNLTIIDISSISNCFAGQIVTILGKEEKNSIFVSDWSKLTGASAYNHLTKLSAHLPKIITP